MTRLIDADRLEDDCNLYDKWDAQIVKEWLKDQPTVDAEPVRHGRWTADESTYTDGFVQCSVCKTTYYADDLYCVGEKAQSELPIYCPHCGAKMMDGEE